MARENTVTIIGSVSKPTISIIEDTGTYKIGFSVTTLRANGRRDHPRVVMYGLSEADARSIWSDIKDNSLVIVNGMISTRLNSHTFTCPKCGASKTVNLLTTELIAYSEPVVIHGDNNILKFSKISNELSVLGQVCSEIQHPTANRTMYQLAVERKLNIAEQPETNVDYPWVKSFGELADMDARRLKKGSLIYLNGSIQTRDIERKIPCDTSGCDGIILSQETVAEIITKNIEYLYRCNF